MNRIDSSTSHVTQQDSLGSHTDHSSTPTSSSLATILQIVLLLGASFAGVWIWRVFSHSPVQAFIIAVAHLLIPGVFLLVGIGLMLFANRKQRPKLTELFTTWITELLETWKVALWQLPFQWRKYSDSDSTHDSQKPVIIFVHGFFCNRGMWNPWHRELKKQGVGFISVNLQPLFGSIDRYTEILEAAVKRAESISTVKPTFVCHSMGGLAVRRWLVSDSKARQRVERIVTIGSPHHGTLLGRFSILLSNTRQMGINSPWLRELSRMELEQRPSETYVGFVCWYSNTDNVVMPAESAMLPGAENRLIRGIGHLALAYHPAVKILKDQSTEI